MRAPEPPPTTLAGRIREAAQQAMSARHVVHHVTLTTAAYQEVGLMPADYRHGPRASKCVVWAMSRDGMRLIPYPVEGT